jgi:hypothetical protein
MPVQVICSYASMPACVQSVCRRLRNAVSILTSGGTKRATFETITHSLVEPWRDRAVRPAAAPSQRDGSRHQLLSGLSTGLSAYSHEIESAFAVVGPAGSIRAVRPTLPQGS